MEQKYEKHFQTIVNSLIKYEIISSCYKLVDNSSVNKFVFPRQHLYYAVYIKVCITFSAQILVSIITENITKIQETIYGPCYYIHNELRIIIWLRDVRLSVMEEIIHHDVSVLDNIDLIFVRPHLDADQSDVNIHHTVKLEKNNITELLVTVSFLWTAPK